HAHGIVHRDLKPGNVMLVKGRAGSSVPQVKLLDFGLAKTGPGTGTSPVAEIETAMNAALTARGTILGTLQYMSPEQLQGGVRDVRGDIWAFGCVLYEMLTGVRAYDGQSPATIISAVLTTEPQPVTKRRANVSPAVDRLIAACLAKDPAARVQSMHDLS